MANYTKRYAYYIKQNKQVSIHEALKLKNAGKVKNRSDDPDFFDTKNSLFREGVTPQKRSVDGRAAHFKYFPRTHEKKILAPKEMTNAHLIYQYMFEKLSYFTIKDNLTNTEIKVFHSSSEMEFVIKATDEDGYILIDVMLGVQRTEPASFKYLWNSKLAIEIKVTHAVDPIKKKILRKNNICTYEAKVPDDFRKEIPEDIDIFEDEDKLTLYINKLIRKYENPKFILFGRFITKSKSDNRHEGAYRMLKQFEEDKKKLEEEIKVMQEKYESISSNSRLLEERNKEYQEANQKYQVTNQKIQKNIDSVNQIYDENKELKQKNKELQNEKQKVENLNMILENSIEELQNQSLWDHIIKLFKK